MTRGVTRRIFLGGALAAAGTQALANAPFSSPFPVYRPTAHGGTAPDPASLIEEARLTGKQGYLVADARTGEVLESLNPLLPLPPASVAKSVTAAYGFAALGTDHAFTTRLIATGPITNGRLEGDLVLAGSGDPVLDTDALAEMARALKASGLREITGDFLIYSKALPYVRAIDPGQPDHLGYNPAVSGLNLNFNRVYFEWEQGSAGYRVSMDARSDHYKPAVSMAQMRVVARDLPVYTYSSKGRVDDWTVAESALGKGGSRWLPVRQPGLYAGEVFQVLARSYGIVLPAPKATARMPGGTVLVDHASASLSAITRLMLKYSTNLTAEVIGMSASTARGGKFNDLKGSAKAMSQWMSDTLGARHADFADHSGLSDKSRVSASDMVKMLVHLGPSGAVRRHMKDVPPRGRGGETLTGAQHVIHAKTGSLNFVSSLAGYVTAPSGRDLAFAIFTGDIPRRDALSREERERPPGARSWGGRSRILQHRLINRWVALYG